MNEENGTTGQKETVVKDTLSQLLDSTYPLLQKFREACPGTYKHSQTISNMIEGIALTLGLDVTFMKVAGLYHDIGKMNNPMYFTENQLDGENPHDKLDPWISFQLISRHVSDSMNILLNDSNFPRELIEIVGQHHGDGVVRYFFEKSDSDVEDRFRYKCSKPQCVESAVLMITDHIEATSRSRFQSGKFDPMDVIETTINGLIDDGQLDEVYMRLGDLKRIKEALAKELEGSYQKRVDYDTAKKSTKKKDNKEEA
jgi:putative nucleotidyltransferase with HDIG domain